MSDGSLYYLHPVKHASSKAGLESPPSNAFQWHVRLGHPHLKKLKLMIPNLHSVSQLRCELSKHCRTSSFLSSRTRSNKLFELIHSDVWGTLSVPNQGSV